MQERVKYQLSGIFPRPNLDHIRKHLMNDLNQALNNWNHIISLKRIEVIDDKVLIILYFMQQVLQAVAQAINIRKEEIDYKCWRWKTAEEDITNEINLSLLDIKKDKLREIKQCNFSNRTIEYEVLLFKNQVCEDRRFLFRIWLPNLENDNEIILLFQLIIPDSRILTKEVTTIIETSLEILLNGIRVADYLSEKGKFFTNTLRQFPNKDLIYTSERLLYYEAWRTSIENEENIINYKTWFNNAGLIVFNNTDQDDVLSTYLTSQMYLVNQGDEESERRLREIIKKDENKIYMKRGPIIKVGELMDRTLCIIALIRIKLYGETSAIWKNKLHQELNSLPIKPTLRLARYLISFCSIIELKTDRLLKEKLTTINAKKVIEEIIANARQIANAVKPLLDETLQKSVKNGVLELSSRWLDTWFGLQLIKDKVIHQNNFQINDPLRLAEILKCWICYFRYLLNYFVIKQLQLNEKKKLPDLPTEPAIDGVDQAQLTLICEWAHVNGVPRTIPLHAWLSKTYETELALYTLSGKGSHRQHLFHVQDECLLGCAMLFSKWDDGINKTFSQMLSEASDINEKELLCNWFVAALLHDIGYALQVIPRGLDSLPDGIIKGLEELVTDIRKKLQQAPPDIADYDPTQTRACNTLEISDHAHVSMAAVLSHLRSICDQWKTASFYNHASAAIVEHGCKDTPINYSSDPLSALIVICDQLQDWGRVRLDTTLLAQNFLSSISISPEEELDPVLLKKMFASSRLYIKVKNLDTECNLIHNLKDKKPFMKFLISGPVAGDGGYEPAVAWLDVCRAFQRIKEDDNKKNLPEISIILQHKVSEDGITELCRLSRYAHENSEQRCTILDWFSYIHNKKGITYEDNTISHPMFKDYFHTETLHKNYEWIEFIIPNLNNNEDRPLKGLPNKLYQTYRDFRKTDSIKKSNLLENINGKTK